MKKTYTVTEFVCDKCKTEFKEEANGRPYFSIIQATIHYVDSGYNISQKDYCNDCSEKIISTIS